MVRGVRLLVSRVASLKCPLPFALPDTPRALELATKWAKGKTSLVKNPSSVIPGDVVVFRFDTGDHVGIVVEASTDAGAFRTVEGNTNGSGGRKAMASITATESLESP